LKSWLKYLVLILSFLLFKPFFLRRYLKSLLLLFFSMFLIFPIYS
jgi:hypothetical protein